MLGEHVGADHQRAGQELGADRLPVGIDLEPGTHPGGNAERRRRPRDPAQVHEGEGGAADHHHQHDCDQGSREDQHPAVGQLVVQPEGEHADHGSAGEADRHPLEHGRSAVLELEVLEEEDHLEALAVDGGEAEGDQADDRRQAGLGQQALAAAMVPADPVRPVDAVDEPVEHHQQDDDRDEAGDGLELGADGEGGVE